MFGLDIEYILVTGKRFMSLIKCVFASAKLFKFTSLFKSFNIIN